MPCSGKMQGAQLSSCLPQRQQGQIHDHSCSTKKNPALVVVLLSDGESGTCAQMLLKLITKEWI